MSETTNVQLIKRLYNVMSKGDLDAAVAMMTDDVTFVVPGPPRVGASGTWCGHTGVRDCFARLTQEQENQSVEIRDFVAQGDKVVVLLHVVASARLTGKKFESDIVHFFTIRNGQIASLLDLFDTAALVEANRL